MLALGASRTSRNAGRYKPYPKQGADAIKLFSAGHLHNRLRTLATRSLEE